MNAQPDAPEPTGPAALPQLLPDSRVLTADEAVDALVTGNHPDTTHGTLALDAALVEALRAGWIVACRLPNGQIALTRITPDAGPTQPA